MRIYAAWLCLLVSPWLQTASGQAPDAQTTVKPPAGGLQFRPSAKAPSPSATKSPEPVLEEAAIPRLLPLGEHAQGLETNGRDDDLGLPSCSIGELKENFLKLKAEREVLQAERLAVAQKPLEDAALCEESLKLRLRLSEVLVRLGARYKQPSGPAQPPFGETPLQPSVSTSISDGTAAKSPAQQADSAPNEGSMVADRPLDPLALANVLFKAENYESALRAYRLIDLRGMKAEDRLPIQYLIATCLKRVGKTDEAAAIYRDIANSRGDENIAVCAQWQLGAIHWQEEMRRNLDSIRQRRGALENAP